MNIRSAPFLIGLIISFLLPFLLTRSVFARSGCCSWHGGVSGCDTNTGRQVCNDGTYSPSCTCDYIPLAPKIETEYQTKTVAIAFKTENINDPSLLEGDTRVAQQGVKGSMEITYQVTYTDGVETSRKKVSETVVKQPTNKVIASGTKKEEPTGEVAGASTQKEEPWVSILVLSALLGFSFLIVKKLRPR